MVSSKVFVESKTFSLFFFFFLNLFVTVQNVGGVGYIGVGFFFSPTRYLHRAEIITATFRDRLRQNFGQVRNNKIGLGTRASLAFPSPAPLRPPRMAVQWNKK